MKENKEELKNIFNDFNEYDNPFGGVTSSTMDSVNLHDYMPGPEVGFRFSTRLYLPEEIFRVD